MRPFQPARSSGRRWKIAECSLSIGSSVAPPRATVSTKRCPPTTSASLLASSSRSPAGCGREARAGDRRRRRSRPSPRRPRDAPPALTSAALAAPSLPWRRRPRAGALLSFARLLGRGDGSEARTMPQRRARAARRCACARSARRSRSGPDARAATSSVARPTEPVAPSTHRRCTGRDESCGRRRHSAASANAIGNTGKRLVDAIEKAAVAGQQRAAVLGACAALDE